MKEAIFVASVVICVIWWLKPYTTVKFFKECRGHPHVDHRFCRHVLKDSRDELRILLREFTNLCSKHGIRAILQAGGLIGWNFNRQMLPWDDDLDMFILEEDISKLLVLNGYKSDNIMVEVNPNYVKRNNDPKNIIDGRVISRKQGCFIDLVFLMKDERTPTILKTKVKNDRFHRDTILPPQLSTFENTSVWVPAAPTALLQVSYGKRSIQPYGHGPPGRHTLWDFVDGEWRRREKT